MEEKDKKTTAVKTVNRTGKKVVAKMVVIKDKKKVEIGKVDVGSIKKLNQARKETQEEKNVGIEGKKEGEKTAEDRSKKEVEKTGNDYKLTIGLKEMLDAGCHLGHKAAKTHPKAKEMIYCTKDGMEIIDLVKTKEALEKAANFLYSIRRGGKNVVMVGTKRQAREIVKRVAQEAGVAWVTDRWLGGTITNWEQIKKDIDKLIGLRKRKDSGELATKSKKEQSLVGKELNRLEKMVGGLANLEKMFDVLVTVDSGFEKTAVREARLRGLQVVSLVDTDQNLVGIDWPIPTNDDNVKSITLMVEELGRALKAGNKG